MDQLRPELVDRAFLAARTGNSVELVTVIEAGLPVDVANDAGDTLMMLAAYYGRAEAVATLICLGADANKANNHGQTPIAGAVFKGEDLVIRALLDGGADPFAGTPSAVDTARMFGREELLALFERHG